MLGYILSGVDTSRSHTWPTGRSLSFQVNSITSSECANLAKIKIKIINAKSSMRNLYFRVSKKSLYIFEFLSYNQTCCTFVQPVRRGIVISAYNLSMVLNPHTMSDPYIWQGIKLFGIRSSTLKFFKQFVECFGRTLTCRGILL